MGISEIFGTSGEELKGKRILIGVTGSIAAIEVPHLVREILRHSGDPIVVLSEAASRFVAKDALTWCMDKEPYTQISGVSEHIQWTSNPQSKVDLFIICPATANTINKMAHGIADGPVTLTALAIIGAKIPLIIVPAAHSVLLDNPITEENARFLRKKGIIVYSTPEDEDKHKFPPLKELMDLIIETTTLKAELESKRYLVTGGATREYIDDVRFISNPSTGKTAFFIAEALKRRGAGVLLVLGEGNTISKDTSLIPSRVVRSAKDMYETVTSELSTGRYDAFISVAAVSDYQPTRTNGKIPSNKRDLSLELIPTVKILGAVRDQYPDLFIVGFKAEVGVSREELLDRATTSLRKNRLNLICANWVGEPNRGFASPTNDLFVIGPEKDPIFLRGSKRELGEKLVDLITSAMTQGRAN
ncbi:MAG: bifunctional phosphopantothenoylcysteine decarboxylase/phosphopantothenate--cysteine ligase CoaBC [Candidatus Heimdallarchaeota archaeon]